MIASDYLKDSDDFLAKLKLIPTLKAFSEAELKGVLQLSKIVKYAPGEPIIKEGDYDNRMYFLVSGKANVAKHGESLSVLRRAGDVFGEMGIIDGSPRSASVIAVDETVCLVTDASYIDRISDNDRLTFCYVLFRIFCEILANRLRITSNELVALKEEIRRLKNEDD
jgi:CRP-like cAMP-binding protein